MYKLEKDNEITFFDFNQTCGMQLDMRNEWVVLSDSINWDSMEKIYAKNFKSNTGHPAKPLRMALGALIIQKRKGLSDRGLVKEIAENPYLQYFIGLKSFSKECPFRATSLVAFRKRLDVDFLIAANELYLETAEATPEHKDDKKLKSKDINEDFNFGTAILDATCSPSNIKYPQDFALLNKARESLRK